MNKNLASMHDEKEKANAMAKKVKPKIIICLLKKLPKVESRNSSKGSRNSNYTVTVTVSNMTDQVMSVLDKH